MLTMSGGRRSTGLPNEGPQNTPMKGQRGITKKVKVHREHNPKKTCLLGTGQANVLAAQRTQKASYSFLILYWQKVLPYCTDTGLLGKFHESIFPTQFTLFSRALVWLSNISSQWSHFKALVTHAIKLPVAPRSSSSSGPSHTTNTESIS